MPAHLRRLLARACVELTDVVDVLVLEVDRFGEPLLEPLLDELVVTADLVRVGERDPVELAATQVLVDAMLEREGIWADEAELASLFVARTEIRRWAELVQAQLASGD